MTGLVLADSGPYVPRRYSAAPGVVLGVDPGSSWIGWAVLDEGVYRSCGVIAVGDDASQREARALLLAIAGAADVTHVAVERVEEVRGRRGGLGTRQASDLVRSAWIGGEIAQAFRATRRPVTTFSAETWRSHFIAPRGFAAPGEKRPKVDVEAVVRVVCETRIPGWPRKVPGVLAKHSGHARDAGGVALYGSRAEVWA